MEHFAGIDVSLKQSSVCVVDDFGNIFGTEAARRTKPSLSQAEGWRSAALDLGSLSGDCQRAGPRNRVSWLGNPRCRAAGENQPSSFRGWRWRWLIISTLRTVANASGDSRKEPSQRAKLWTQTRGLSAVGRLARHLVATR
jgi:hypothetical protein